MANEVEVVKYDIKVTYYSPATTYNSNLEVAARTTEDLEFDEITEAIRENATQISNVFDAQDAVRVMIEVKRRGPSA